MRRLGETTFFYNRLSRIKFAMRDMTKVARLAGFKCCGHLAFWFVNTRTGEGDVKDSSPLPEPVKLERTLRQTNLTSAEHMREAVNVWNCGLNRSVEFGKEIQVSAAPEICQSMTTIIHWQRKLAKL